MESKNPLPSPGAGGSIEGKVSSSTRCPLPSLTLQRQAVSARFTRSHIILWLAAPLPSPDASWTNEGKNNIWYGWKIGNELYSTMKYD